MSNNQHKKWKKAFLDEKKKSIICKNDFEKTVYEMAIKHYGSITEVEFCMFYINLNFFLKLSQKQIKELKNQQKNYLK